MKNIFILLKMKKKLLILSAIFISMLGFAGTKEDLESAVNKYSEHKNVEILEKDLKAIASKKSDEFTNIAKSNLVNIALSKNNQAEALKYLNEIADAKEASKELRINALLSLYRVAQTPDERIKLSEKILKIEPEANLYHIGMIADYTLKADSEYKKLIASTKAEDKGTVELTLANEFLLRGLVKEGTEKYNQLTKDKNDIVKATAYYKLATLSSDVDMAIKNALEAKKTLKNLDYYVEKLLSNLYETKKDYKKSLEFSKNMLTASKNIESYSYVVFFAELTKDTKLVNSTLNEMKTTFKGQENIINLALAENFLSYGNTTLAEKYAKEALNKDKQNEAIITLLNIYISTSNKKEALKYLNEAKKAKFNGLEEVEKIINEIK